MLRFLLAGGATLGSVSPLIAIRESFPHANFLFVGTHAGPERSFVESHGIRYRSIGTSKWRRYVSILNVIDAIKFPFSIAQAYAIVSRYRPHCILTAGGFVAVPIAISGWFLRIPVFIHQQDIVLTLSNRIMQHFATVITTTFEEQKKFFPTHKTFCTGNPIRTITSEEYPEKNMILVLGGSIGARGMNDMVNTILPSLSRRCEIVQVLGQKNYHQRLHLDANYTAVGSLSTDYGKYLQQAKIVITRAGMQTLTELAANKKAAVVIPMPNTHQEANADFFARHKAAVVIPQSNSSLLEKTVSDLLESHERRQALGNKLHDLFPKDANEKYASLIKRYISESHEKPVAYFVGIGGIGVSALVRYFQHKGYSVLGSDISRNAITEQLEAEGVKIFHQHKKDNLKDNVSMVIYSTAVPDNNEELIAARRRHLDLYSYKEYLGLLSRQKKTIAISGTHGKTTTTALTGLILKEAMLSPTIIVGSLVPQLGKSNFSPGTSDWLVVEADEYRADMLLLDPAIAVITSIDADHLDYYKNLDEIKTNFQKFADTVAKDGLLVKNIDDPYVASIQAQRMITVGISEKADYSAHHIVIRNARQYFDVHHHGGSLGNFSLPIPGLFNIRNALAALAVARHLGVADEKIRAVFESFQGSWRRFERIGSFQGSPVYSDYAHHPTEVQETLRAIEEFYPDRRLVVVFQPHSFDRTEKLFAQFSQSFNHAHVLILTEIYDVVGRDEAHHITSKDLFGTIGRQDSFYVESLDDLRPLLAKIHQKNDVIVFMGAGDIDSAARALLKK